MTHRHECHMAGKGLLSKETAMARKLKERWKALLAEYGRVALVIYLVLFVGSIVGFGIAISSGLDLGDWTGGKAGTIAAAWVATKFTQPIRIGVTLVLTPIVAGIFRKPEKSSDLPSEPGDESE